ncbi:hypothetical protein RLH23_10815 [Streptococcus pneumoniae]|nr:hypothetical protein [Streptococcus pneumoniae]
MEESARLTIAERTEKVVVLDQGKIVEEGKHADLLATVISNCTITCII